MYAYIVAPTDLPAGYKFKACLPDQPNVTFEAIVPYTNQNHNGTDGGVREGEMFLTPLPEMYTSKRKIQAPIGYWKDGLFSCFRHGFFHPHVWCSFCCCHVMLAQIMTRMRFSWLGQPTYGQDANNTFQIVITLVISFIVFTLAMDAYEYSYIITGEINQMNPLVTVCKVLAYASFGLWSIYSIYQTRFHIRAIYSIPESSYSSSWPRICQGCEDGILSTCCCCCTVGQMARHTGDYETNHATLFSTTGLSKNYTPGIV